jgi:dsRNA-specific ribonuclease
MNNPVNKLIQKQDVENILNYFGNIGDNNSRLLVNNLEFYQAAFIHESYHQAVQNYLTNPDPNVKIYLNYITKESSERLEYLGDSVLKTCLGRYLYKRFPMEREGFLTRLKIKMEKCSMLHQIAVTLGFKDFLLLSLQIENMTLFGNDRGRGSPSAYEDAFESFLGSIMEDFGEKGYIYADRFIINIIESIIDFSELVSTNDNYKDSLQRWVQKQQKDNTNNITWKTPVYSTIEEQGPLYRKVFTRMLTITKEQFNELSQSQKDVIKRYTFETLEYYKTRDPKVFTDLFNKLSGSYILCIGSERRVVSAEQEAAKQGLINLGLDLNY